MPHDSTAAATEAAAIGITARDVPATEVAATEFAATEFAATDAAATEAATTEAAPKVAAHDAAATEFATVIAIDFDAVILTLAARQFGVVARYQLLSAGVPRHAIKYRVKKGLLKCLFRGVYLVGPVAGRYATEMAVVLACGESAVLSHHSAIALWSGVPRRTDADTVHVTAARRHPVPGRAVRVHRSRLQPDEVTRHDAIPITVPSRTLLDLASTARQRELEQAWAQIERQGLATSDEVMRMLARYPRRAGTRRLRALLASGQTTLTRSEAEELFLRIVRRGGLGKPEVNVVVRGYEVDFLWRAERLIVEIDGFEFHSSRAAFERDRARDEDLVAAGMRVLRVTWRRLSKTPEEVLVNVAQALVH